MVNCDWTSGDTKNSTKDPNAWKCWEWNDITNEEGEPAYVLFTEEGEQEIKLLIGPASIGDMGPLAFEFVEGIENAPEEEKEWDELEKSIIASIADDVIVGVKGSQADIIIVKKFA